MKLIYLLFNETDIPLLFNETDIPLLFDETDIPLLFDETDIPLLFDDICLAENHDRIKNADCNSLYRRFFCFVCL